MPRSLRMLSTAALCVAIGLGCDTASNPIAPSGSVLTLSATPSSIEASETSTVTVTGFRPDGNPASGAMVVLAADAGTLSSTLVTLDAQGRAQVVYTAPAMAVNARVSGTLDNAQASVTIEVTSPGGQLAVTPTAVELHHDRSSSGCDDPIDPEIAVSNLGSLPLSFKIVKDLPDWLTTDVSSGSVPGTFRALFTCAVGDGDLDLSHVIRVRGIDPSTGERLGDPVTVTVDVHVRD